MREVILQCSVCKIALPLSKQPLELHFNFLPKRFTMFCDIRCRIWLEHYPFDVDGKLGWTEVVAKNDTNRESFQYTPIGNQKPLCASVSSIKPRTSERLPCMPPPLL